MQAPVDLDLLQKHRQKYNLVVDEPVLTHYEQEFILLSIFRKNKIIHYIGQYNSQGSIVALILPPLYVFLILLLWTGIYIIIYI